MKKPRFIVVWDTERDSDNYAPFFDTLECAKSAALDTLVNWMVDFDPSLEDGPAEDEWDCMIDNCSVQVNELDSKTGNYNKVWEPSDDDLKKIGWIEWDDMDEETHKMYKDNWEFFNDKD